MRTNVGGYDRLVRFVLGPTAVIAGAALVSGLLTLFRGPVGFGLGAALLLVGAVLLTTAVTGSCPLYRALGIDTFRSRSARVRDGHDSRDDAGESRTPPN